MKCAFCLTGKMGLTRHLTAGEIAAQVRLLANDTGLADRAFNIVVMGMGEPLHNYDATMKALRMVGAAEGLAVPPRRITLSTVGLVPAIERLATEPFMPNLAISLHATTSEQRDALVPINRKFDLDALIEACRRFPVKRRSRITFEYVLLAGVNDTPADARRLVKLLVGAAGKGEPAAAERRARHSVRAAVGRAGQRVCGHSGGEGGHRVGAEEPRP